MSNNYSKTNGNTAAQSPLSPASRDSMEKLRREVVELARTLPGDLRRLAVRSADCEIEVEWATTAPAFSTRTTPFTVDDDQISCAEADPTVGTFAVRAPLVGTFYTAQSPEADPFVQVGDEVEAGMTLAIIEAMKMMNPIVAEQDGVVTEVLVANNESVEYDQVLFRLVPRDRT